MMMGDDGKVQSSTWGLLEDPIPGIIGQLCFTCDDMSLDALFSITEWLLLNKTQSAILCK